MFLELYPLFLVPLTFVDLQFLLTVIITVIIVLLLQRIIKDPRPQLYSYMGYGFPSMHATITTLITLWVILEMETRFNITDKSQQLFISTILIFFLILVCISRIQHGYHTIPQVLGGILLAIIIISIYFAIAKQDMRKNSLIL